MAIFYLFKNNQNLSLVAWIPRCPMLSWKRIHFRLWSSHCVGDVYKYLSGMTSVLIDLTAHNSGNAPRPAPPRHTQPTLSPNCPLGSSSRDVINLVILLHILSLNIINRALASVAWPSSSLLPLLVKVLTIKNIIILFHEPCIAKLSCKSMIIYRWKTEAGLGLLCSVEVESVRVYPAGDMSSIAQIKGARLN